MKVIQYTKKHQAQWDDVITKADNGHFIFQRAFMEYHQDRHHDCSFLVEHDSNIIGVIPGTVEKQCWHSHGGLPFGGLFLAARYNKASVVSEAYDVLFAILKEGGFTHAKIKPVPWIYHKRPAEAELYWLATRNIQCNYSELTTAVSLPKQGGISTLRKRMCKKAHALGFETRISTDFGEFWNCLTKLLLEKYGKAPVHTLEEIQELAVKFPENILLYCVFDPNKNLVGGSVCLQQIQCGMLNTSHRLIWEKVWSTR